MKNRNEWKQRVCYVLSETEGGFLPGTWTTIWMSGYLITTGRRVYLGKPYLIELGAAL